VPLLHLLGLGGYMVSDKVEEKHLFSAALVALMPGLYAWQIYGWIAGAVVYVIVIGLLTALTWALLFRDWSFRWIVGARLFVILIAMAAIGLSAMENCNLELTECHRAFWPK
jgi:hypothetical protein